MKKRMRIGGALPLMAAAVLCFGIAVARLDRGRDAEGKALLEDALRRTAVACYAAEGFYPPDVEYMSRHYGLTFDQEKYLVHYEVFASNLMPDITVVEK